MFIAGLQKTSLLDYPGKISAIIFTSGCNFKCSFCHNPELVKPNSKITKIPEKDFFDFLNKRKNILDAVVITGGEPTLQNDLVPFIKKIKKLGFLVKLDTNGSSPKIIEQLLKNRLIDYIAMDIKGPLDKYHKITTQKIDLENIKKSVEFIKNCKIDYEFRTTVVPTLLDEQDFAKTGEWLKGTKIYYLQQFRNEKTLNKNLKNTSPYPAKTLRLFANIMKKYVKEVKIRGIGDA
ncbi:MAG: anaerobic ribonucleoside-triphosphate reductase activating protein [Patescibacteria group bacterium]|nr:anaerobic ribonucleoside-triphosphate reductase activating protein [Patescibacteria group bacterium]